MANEFLYPGILKFCVLGLAFPEESAKEKREGEKKRFSRTAAKAVYSLDKLLTLWKPVSKAQ